MLVVPLVVSSLSGAACSHKGTASAVSEPQTEDEKTFYALASCSGATSARLRRLTASSRSSRPVFRPGYEEQGQGRHRQVRPTIDALARKRAAARAELEKGKSAAVDRRRVQRAGRHQAPVGHGHQDDPSGTGAQPEAADQVKVHYEGKLTDGTTFDSSIKRGEPAVFPLNGVIKCWTEGVGPHEDRREGDADVPLGAGLRRRGPTARDSGGATLIFDVELLDITKAAPPAMTMPAPGLQAPQLKLKQK